MPGKNTVKEFIEDGWYHIYNRGVEKRTIFEDEKDYAIFLFFIKKYLTLKWSEPLQSPHPLASEIELTTFCLMPNHFHLLIKQKNKNSISKFIKCLATNYSMYFNQRYERVGKLFQGVYRAVRVETDEELIHIHRYIHLNPQQINRNPFEYLFSSYPYYIGKQKSNWLHPNFILDILGSIEKYQEFLEYMKKDNSGFLEFLTIEKGWDPRQGLTLLSA